MPLTRRLTPPPRYDFAGTLGALRTGPHDPTARLDRAGLAWAARTPDGPGALLVERDLTVQAWGDGAGWLMTQAPDILGLNDDLSGFADLAARHPVVAQLAKEHAGLRLPRTGLVLRTLVPVILAQKVTFSEAVRAYGRLVRAFGEPAPGPLGLVLPPDPAALADAPYWRYHPFGVEQKRADTIRRAAAEARALEAADPATAAARMAVIRGIGPWTVAEVARAAFGDADAVSVGDFHVPHQVAWALAGEPRGDDARMLELLAPFGGHRGRVTTLLVRAGIRAPRYGPRLAPRSFARF